MRQTKQNTKPPFIVVYGAPRTGTSLTMDIVKAAGFNSGGCYPPPLDPRRGRNEHRFFGQPLENWQSPVLWNHIEKEGITCAKIINYPEWIDFLREKFDVRIVATNRSREDRQASAGDMLVHIRSREQKVQIQNTILRKRDNFLMDWDGPVRLVQFELLVKKDMREFVRLANFLEFKGSIEDLMTPVKSDRVKFRQWIDTEVEIVNGT